MWRTRSPGCCSINPIVDVSRRDDGVERVGRNPKLQHLPFDRRRGPRSVADQNDRAAPFLKRNSASEAGAKEATPLCKTPQMSHRIAS